MPYKRTPVNPEIFLAQKNQQSLFAVEKTKPMLTPKNISSFFGLLKSLDENPSPTANLSKNGISVEKMIDIRNGQPLLRKKTKYYFLHVNKQKLFIKRRPKQHAVTRGGGHREFNSSVLAKILLQHHPELENVRVVEYMFSFENKVDTFFGSIKEKFMLLNDFYKKAKKTPEGQITTDELTNRIKNIQLVFNEYFDLNPHNIGYNPETEEIILFDINKRSERNLKKRRIKSINNLKSQFNDAKNLQP